MSLFATNARQATINNARVTAKQLNGAELKVKAIQKPHAE